MMLKEKQIRAVKFPRKFLNSFLVMSGVNNESPAASVISLIRRALKVLLLA